MKKNIILFLKSVFWTTLLTLQSCNDNKCENTNTINPTAPPGCTMTNYLKLSTGIDSNNNVIPPGLGIVDPFWKLLNNPPLISCSNSLSSSINGSAYLVNYANSTATNWVNQPNSTTICPVDLGTSNSFGCNNASNSAGNKVPYVFERSFCVLTDTKVDFNFTYRGDDQMYLELVNNNTNTVLATSTTYTYPAATATWNASALSLSAGSYSIRVYLTNTDAIVLGFSVVGDLKTSNNDLAISNNTKGCCENNTISILNILDSNCNGAFDSTDTFGTGWTFTLRNSSGGTAKTAVTDNNGNIFFSGIPDGTYTFVTTPVDPYLPSNPTGGTITFTISGNTVKNLTFYNCTK